ARASCRPGCRGSRACPAESRERGDSMAVKIRLARHGSKKKPVYRIVVAHSESPRDGRYIDQVGIYDPTRSPSLVPFQPVTPPPPPKQRTTPPRKLGHVVEEGPSADSDRTKAHPQDGAGRPHCLIMADSRSRDRHEGTGHLSRQAPGESPRGGRGDGDPG